jgi:cation diffusion facilitator family transporter
MSLERSATVVATLTAALLAIVKFIVGALSGSIAVMASAIDSLLDLLVSMFNYVAITNAEKPADEKFNYGRGKFEAMASFIEGAVISGSGLFILYESINKLAHSEVVKNIDVSIYVMIFSFIVTAMLVLFLNYVAKKKNSLVIKSDALHYKTDMYTNGGVLISLVILQFTDFHAIDGIVGALIAIYIIYSASSLIKESFFMLTDRALEDEMVEQIENIITSKKKISGYHYLKTRRSGNSYFLDVHLVFNRDLLLVDAHAVSDEIEDEISKLGDENVEWNFNIHLDPSDDSDEDSLLPSMHTKATS